MELCKISIAFSLVVLALFSRMRTHGSIGATQPSSTQSNVTVAAAPNPASMKNGSYAADYAEKRISDCDLVHSGGPYGENLAWSSTDLSGPDAMRLWIDEKDYYNFKSGVCDSSHVCRQYTQVIGRNSSRLGCAKVIGSNNGGTFVICNYDPPSNDPIGKNQSNIMVATVPNPSSATEGLLP
ncbi:pathogenesis-related protein 1-like [Gossypium hirsutum]|uniref:Pathogenesis-related protein 1-like n=1 Tax=Gossypium hirsutum TaxID=3635 RepID=A0ABM3BBS0_GOSHI|nr:pathogenesis-related protein 1-like [Gossypium hirsutum]